MIATIQAYIQQRSEGGSEGCRPTKKSNNPNLKSGKDEKISMAKCPFYNERVCTYLHMCSVAVLAQAIHKQ